MQACGSPKRPGTFFGSNLPPKKMKSSPLKVKYKKKEGSADKSGENYETKLLMLLAIRLLKKKTNFRLGSNVDAAGLFDDIVFSNKDKIVLAQLKHRRHKKNVDAQLLRINNDFSLLMYFKSYCDLKKCWNGNQDLSYLGKFEDVTFVLHTNATGLHCREAVSNDLVDLLDTHGSCIRFTRNRDRDIFELFDNLSNLKDALNKLVNKQQLSGFDQRLCDTFLPKLTGVANVPEGKLREILDFLNSIADITDHEKFLDNLVVYSGGKNEDGLDTLIKQEMIVGNHDYLNFKEKIEKWQCRHHHFMSEMLNPYLEIVKSRVDELRPSTLKSLLNQRLAFSQSAINEFQDKIPATNKIYVSSTHPILTGLKILQCSDERLLLVDVNALNSNCNELQDLLSWWCDVLVVLDAGNSHPNLPQASKIICISTEKSYPVSDDLNFTQLDIDSQNHILNARVKFQGFYVTLREITGSSNDLIPMQAILQLMLGEEVILGNDVNNDSSFYIDHTLLYAHTVMDLGILKTQDDVLAISGISANQLQKLVPTDVKVGEVNQFEVCHRSTVYPITNEKQFKLLGKSYKNVHWLHYSDTVLEYKKSEGKNFPKKWISSIGSPYNDLKSVSSVPHSAVMVSAPPGMGKSTLLCHLFHGTKQDKPAQWVIFVNLNSCSGELAKLHDRMKLTEIYEFLLKSSGISGDWLKFFEKKLYSMQDVYMLFDAFDEIAPNYTNRVTRMLRELLQNKVGKLWITTRPIMKDVLEYDLPTVTLTLQPFTEDKRKKFLTEYWKPGLSDSQLLLIQTFIEELLHLTATNLNDLEKSFTGVPLQCRLLAEVFEDEMKNYVKTEKICLPKKFNLLKLYKLFIDKKFDEYYKKNNLHQFNSATSDICKLKREKTEENQKTAALRAHVSDKQFNTFCTRKPQFRDFKKDFKLGHEKTGIIAEINQGMPIFVHMTFCEYYFARWLCDEYDKGTVKEFIREKLLNRKYQVIRHFMNRMLAETFDLHDAVISIDKNTVNTLLQENCDVNEKDFGGRTALHLAVMSLFDNEVSHDFDTIVEITQLLLLRGAKTDIKDKVFHLTPLELGKKSDFFPSAMKKMLSSGMGN